MRSVQQFFSHIPPFIFYSAMSGLLMTGAFPKVGLDWLAWFALVPLLLSLKGLSLKESFYAGFVAGLCHYLTLTHWLAYTMRTYGNLPWYLCYPVLLLLAAYLALYIALFSIGVNRLCRTSGSAFLMVPILWVTSEYIRSFFLTGFPWELLGYSQYKRLALIQISDITGVYGVSFLIAMANSLIFLSVLYLRKVAPGRGKDDDEVSVSKNLGPTLIIFVVIFGLVWFYGKVRIAAVDELAATAPRIKTGIIQGNIDQAIKWDPAFQVSTVQKYIDMSLSLKADKPDMVIWPETATPFYFLYNPEMTEMVLRGIQQTRTSFLIGSPSFVVTDEKQVEYYNSAYLIDKHGNLAGKYDKTHLVPFGEYVPLKKWLPFVGKMVQHVGDFSPGKKGNTLNMGKKRVGVQICYEIIFPNLSRSMVQNKANLLVNLTNDAWYGTTGGPYQHFSMTVFRAAENKRSLIRAANTGISGFIDPLGRVIASSSLCKDAVLSNSVSLLEEKTLYTRFGDMFALVCLIITMGCVYGGKGKR